MFNPTLAIRVFVALVSAGACGKTSSFGEAEGTTGDAGMDEGGLPAESECASEEDSTSRPDIILDPPYGFDEEGEFTLYRYEATCTVIEDESGDEAVQMGLLCTDEDSTQRIGQVRSGGQLALPFELGSTVTVVHHMQASFEGPSQVVVRISNDDSLFVSGRYTGPGSGWEFLDAHASVRDMGAAELALPSALLECASTHSDGGTVKSYALVLDSGLSDSTSEGPSHDGADSLRVYDAREFLMNGSAVNLALRFEYTRG